MLKSAEDWRKSFGVDELTKSVTRSLSLLLPRHTALLTCLTLYQEL